MDKSRERGQALIEFVLLLPVIIFLILAVIDIGRILYAKIHLESKIGEVVDLVNDDIKDPTKLEKIINDDNGKIAVNVLYHDDIEIVLSSEMTFVTPGFNLFLDNPYNIKIKRIIAND